MRETNPGPNFDVEVVIPSRIREDYDVSIRFFEQAASAPLERRVELAYTEARRKARFARFPIDHVLSPDEPILDGSGFRALGQPVEPAIADAVRRGLRDGDEARRAAERAVRSIA